MPKSPKALVVACEKYPRGEDIAQELKGTLDSARAFCQWLREEKKLPAADIYVCCDAELLAGHPADRSFPSTRPGISDAITELVEAHRDKVDEFYFFFSGHGLGYEQSPQQRGLDLLLATDYRSRKKSGAACLNIGQLLAQLEIWLGAEDYYYFLDACRTVLKAGEIVPEGLGLALDPASPSDPTTYALFSTRFGEVAAVNPKFPNALLAGLRGEGRAKTRVNREWWVRFDRLQKYVDAQVDIPTDSVKLGARDGLIAKLDKTFETTLKVTVDGADAAAPFELKVSNGIEQVFPFVGPGFEKKLPPNDGGYAFSAFSHGQPLNLVSPQDAKSFDLYEPVELRYRTGPPTRLPEMPPPSPPPPTEQESRVRASIAHRVPNQDRGRVMYFSETLGPLSEQNTALWLSLLGASRIIRDPGLYSKIGNFPLARFEDLAPGESAIYVLAGLDLAAQAQLAISVDANVLWNSLEPVAGLDGVAHVRMKPGLGSRLVSLALPDRPPVTFASYALPNRATLFVVTEDKDGKLDARQMLLPVYSLGQYLPTEVTWRAFNEGLRLVRYLLLQQDRFAKRESVVPAGGREREDLEELLYGKWLDPLLALTALYEMARRGGLKTDRSKMQIAVGNLERFFAELPDVAAVRHLIDPNSPKLPVGTPLLRESLLRLPKSQERLPLPAGLLDYSSMWTSWVGAVSAPKWN